MNGGSGTIESQTKTYGEDLTLSGVVLARDGYIFVGWSTDKDATSVMYLSGGTYSKNEDVTLYAVWRPTILYLFNKGDQNTDVTGGWVATNRRHSATSGYSYMAHTPVLSISNTTMSVTLTNSEHNYENGCVETVNDIDLSLYNRLVYVVTSVTSEYVSWSGESTRVVLGAITTDSTSLANYSVEESITSSGTYTLDVSGINGTRKIVVNPYTVADRGQTAAAVISQIYLE